MNCYFCQQPCIHKKRLAIGTGEDWICDNHPLRVTHEVNFTYHKKGDCDGPDCCPKKHFEAISIRWTKGTQLYDAEWNIKHNLFRLFILNYGEIFGLVGFPPNVTPENVEAKMATYITFS